MLNIMIFRIFIIILIIVFRKQIFDFLKNYKIDTPTNIKNKIVNNTKKFVDTIVNHEVKEVLSIVKKIDRETYRKCIKILKNIRKIKNDLDRGVEIDFKNEFENLKLQKKEVLNLLAALVVSHGFFSSQERITEVLEEYLKNILIEVLDIAVRRKYDISWFEDDIDEVEPNDIYSPGFSYNYNIY